MEQESDKRLEDRLSDLRECLAHEQLITAVYEEKRRETLEQISLVRREQLRRELDS